MAVPLTRGGKVLVCLFLYFLVEYCAAAWIPLQFPRRRALARKSTALTMVKPQRSQLVLPKSGKTAHIISRTVELAEDWNVTIWELDRPASVMEHYWSVQQHHRFGGQSGDDDVLLDPFGLVSWPGAVVAAQELQRRQGAIVNATVLVLGAGTGLESQAVAKLGAKQVLATDIHPTALLLLRHGAEKAELSHVISERVLDLFSAEPLPECDILLAADVLYNPTLAKQVGKRCQEAIEFNPQVKILISDSQRFQGTDFVPELNDFLRAKGWGRVEWEDRALLNFTGSGVMVDEDQTYNVSSRVLSYGWDAKR